MACNLQLVTCSLQLATCNLQQVQYPGVAESIQSDLWSLKQLVEYTGVVPPGLYLDQVLEVASRLNLG